MSVFSIAELQSAIDQFGADQARWPEATARAAEDLLSRSADARQLMADAVALDRALRGETVRAPSGLADRIVSAAGKLPQKPGKSRPN